MITRRGLIGILGGAIAAPIVVRSGLLMPVRPVIWHPPLIQFHYVRYSGFDTIDISEPQLVQPTAMFAEQYDGVKWVRIKSASDWRAEQAA